MGPLASLCLRSEDHFPYIRENENVTSQNKSSTLTSTKAFALIVAEDTCCGNKKWPTSVEKFDWQHFPE